MKSPTGWINLIQLRHDKRSLPYKTNLCLGHQTELIFMVKIFIFVQKNVLSAKTHIHKVFDSGSNPLASIKTGIFLLSIFRPIYFLRVSFGHLAYLIQSNRYCDIQILVFVSCKKKGRILGPTRVRMKNPHIFKKNLRIIAINVIRHIKYFEAYIKKNK